MFYTKAQITDDIEIKVNLYDEEIYCTCPICGSEVNVETEMLANVLQDGDFSSSAVYCDPCGDEYRRNQVKEMIVTNDDSKAKTTQDYGDMWHLVMDEIIDVENGKVDHLDATQKIMDKFAELLKNNGMDINQIPTVKEA